MRLAFAVVASFMGLASGLTTQQGNQSAPGNSAADHCDFHKRCSTCVGYESCVWCQDTGSCVPGTDRGATNMNYTKMNYRYCPGETCDSYTHCQSCTSDPFCGWCKSSASCHDGFVERPAQGSCEVWEKRTCDTPYGLLDPDPRHYGEPDDGTLSAN